MLQFVITALQAHGALQRRGHVRLANEKGLQCGRAATRRVPISDMPDQRDEPVPTQRPLHERIIPPSPQRLERCPACKPLINCNNKL